VQFFDGTTLLNTATLSSGTASYSTTTFAAGTSHALTAVYLGDANFTGSNSGAAKTVTVSGVLGLLHHTDHPQQQYLPGQHR
jgi:hypothetical protein